jgi:hypothetical protein
MQNVASCLALLNERRAHRADESERGYDESEQCPER